ncbi:GerMN domain-containing protein [Patescibacteria group bacterium]|nr:GerMN domain-containing protein [Patescibacteria group bacterium]
MAKKKENNLSLWWTLAIIPLVLLGIWVYTTTSQLKKPSVIQSNTQSVLVYYVVPTETDFDFVAVERIVPKTNAINELALATIQEWIKGPTEGQRSQGMSSPLNDGVVVNSVNIDNGQAIIDFNNNFDTPMGGSARVVAISGSIERLMKQFEVDGMANIALTINNGERDAVLEP